MIERAVAVRPRRSRTTSPTAIRGARRSDSAMPCRDWGRERTANACEAIPLDLTAENLCDGRVVVLRAFQGCDGRKTTFFANLVK